MKTLERIDKDGKEFADTMGRYPGLEQFLSEAFIDGAKSERNKVIDEAIQKVKEYRNWDAEKSFRDNVVDILNSLKI